jgi:hypothetical protein
MPEGFATFPSLSPSQGFEEANPQKTQARPPPKSFKFDRNILTKYQSEDQDVVLFNWLSNLKQDLLLVDKVYKYCVSILTLT